MKKASTSLQNKWQRIAATTKRIEDDKLERQMKEDKKETQRIEEEKNKQPLKKTNKILG